MIEAWPMLTEDVRAAILRLAGVRLDDLNDVDDVALARAGGEGMLS
jgi:hypothetical protein